MKLKELLEKHLPDVGDFNTLYSKKDLEGLKDEILQCDEFSECTELHFMELPAMLLNDEPKVAKTYKVPKGTKFKGVCHLLSLCFTPFVYDPTAISYPRKDGAAITPALYNPKTFEPTKKILLEFSPEGPADSDETIKRKELHDLLDKVLDNAKDYEIQGERHVLVRGVFEDYYINDKI